MHSRERPLILVADDDPIIAIVACAAVESAGMDVITASSGTEALALFAGASPDAVMLDVMMPDLDGYEVCKRLRQLPAGASVPVLMMTALDDPQSIDLAYECGATAFVTKPIHPVMLGHRLRFQLRAARAITEARESAARLLRAQTLARLVQWELDTSSSRFTWSAATGGVFGEALAAGDGSKESFLRLVHAEDRERVQRVLSQAEAHRIDYRLVLPGIGERIVHQEAELVDDRGLGHVRLLGATQDVTDLRLAERTIARMTLEDELTGLPNRDSARSALETAIADVATVDTIAVLTVGLDNFKRVNDVFGRAGGDVLLRGVARRLEERVCALEIAGALQTTGCVASVVARAGADEFVVLLPGLHDAAETGRVVRALTEALAAPYDLDGVSLTVTSSIGVAICPEDSKDAEVLLERSAAAMHHAKLGGRNQFKFFTASLQTSVDQSHYVESLLRAALASGEDLALAYQPKVELPSRRVVGVEALLRWVGPRDTVSPFDLITVAEATGLIIPLGDWVLLTACRQAKSWQEQGIHGVRMAVNIAPRHFAAPDFVERLGQIIAEVGLRPGTLELEITEGTMLQNATSVSETLAAIKRLGVRIALDDFGTGFSSLSYLTTLPIDTLKVDRSFVIGLGKSTKNDTITEAIIRLAQSLEIDVVVEGVETHTQLAFFFGRGTVAIQGWFFSKALLSAEATTWLREWPGRKSAPALRAVG